MAQRHIFYFLRRCEIGAHESANFFSSGIVRNRSEKAEVLSLVGNVELPAEPGNRVSFTQKKTIAEFGIGIGSTSAVHEAQNAFSAAVRNFEEDGVVPFIHVLGLEEIKVRREFHFSLGVARRFVEIDDLAVVEIFWIHSEIDAPNDPLVGASESEWPAILDVRAGNDFGADNARACARSEQNNTDQNANHPCTHAPRKTHKHLREAPQLTTAQVV